MKILTVCSGLDFVNYTRRATIEAIHMLNPDMDILMFNSILNLGKRKNIVVQIRFYYYHFWIFESFRGIFFLKYFEYSIRYLKWKRFFKKYEVVFFIDPNQYYLLPYLSPNQKLVYLLRDPNILLAPDNYRKELPVLKRANLVLAISKGLCGYYFEKYYNFKHENVKLWSNTVDIDLWNYNKLKTLIKQKTRPIMGLAGNIDFVIDLKLLIFLANQLPEIDLEIAGKLDLNIEEQKLWDTLISCTNVKYLGFIPYNDFPTKVINWDIGIVAAKPDHEFAKYLNNNKQYQYVALGKPFVTYSLDAEYKDFEDMVFVAESREDFVLKIKMAYIKSKEVNTSEKGLMIAKKQSSQVRALEFLNYLN